MLKPIKRVWVPRAAASAASAAAASSVTAAVPAAKAHAPTTATAGQVFNELPETEVQERDSDSVWAEFESVYARASANKTNPA